MLARAGLGNDALLAHALGQHRLADHVVDLVRAGMVQLFALEVDLGAAHFSAHAGRMVDGRRPAHVVVELGRELGDEFGVVLVACVGLAQLGQRVGQGFTGKAAAIAAEMPGGVRVLVVKHYKFSRVWASAARTAATKR
ncbi:hypothetical protein D3C78_1275950 [compost metagenome]